MKTPNAFIVFSVILTIVTGSTCAMLLQERKPRKVTRVKRPVFTQRDWDGIYFENLFEQGLVGERPAAGQLGKKPADIAVAGEQNSSLEAGGFAWSNLIANDVLEDEVKALQQALERDITTPVKFKSEYLKSRQSYSILSLMFAIIRDYDTDDVRWKKYAPIAQVAFARSAAASRVGSEQAYQNARLRKEDLVELVRGGTFAANETAPEKLEWPLVVDRTPMMVRLQSAIDKLKPAMSNKTEFTKNIDLVYHEASIIAVIGEALIMEDMDEFDEEGYAEFAKAMTTAATAVVNAARNQDYDSGSNSANLIEQACSNCHQEWR